MRLEGHRDGGSVAFVGDPPHALDDLQVAPVHAVEVAQCEHRVHPRLGPRIVRIMYDVHYKLISNERPSYANSTPGGMRAQVAACGRSWHMCVKYARDGPSRSTTAIASFRERCVGCGRSRSASRISVCTPARSGHDSPGMALQSVKYANEPIR